MRITIQVTCENSAEALEVITKLNRKHETWDEQLDKSVVAPKSSTEVPKSPPVSASTEDSERPNVSPGEPSIGKIGSTTKAMILADLRDGKPMHPKLAEHCKLLWQRGEIKFDGTDYYI